MNDFLELKLTLGQLLIAVSTAGPLLLLGIRYARKDAINAEKMDTLKTNQDYIWTEIKDMKNDIKQLPAIIMAMLNIRDRKE